jgi:hypothetical protein
MAGAAIPPDAFPSRAVSWPLTLPSPPKMGARCWVGLLSGGSSLVAWIVCPSPYPLPEDLGESEAMGSGGNGFPCDAEWRKRGCSGGSKANGSLPPEAGGGGGGGSG